MNLRLLCKFFLFLFPVFTSFAQELNVPIEHWSSSVLDRFEVKGRIGLLPISRPWNREIVKKSVSRQVGGMSSGDYWLFEKLKEDFIDGLWEKRKRKYADKPAFVFDSGQEHAGVDLNFFQEVNSKKDNSTKGFTEMNLSGLGEHHSGFAFEEAMRFNHEGGFKKDDTIFSRVGVRTWRGGTASVDRAYFAMRLPIFGIRMEVGRDNQWWGPGRKGTLIVSNNSHFDMISISGKFNRFRGYFFASVIDNVKQKYISGHRIVLEVPLRTQVGISEVVVYQGRNPEPIYLNPLIPYYLAQHNLFSDDNILWSVDFSSIPFYGLKLYGEILIDDYQYEQNPPAPNKLGYLGGLYFIDPLYVNGLDFRIEYTRINRWVYSHRESSNVYINEGKYIGHWLGPDSDLLFFKISNKAIKKLAIELSYEIERHGEARDPYSSWSPKIDPKTRTLTGIVEKTQRTTGEIFYEPFWWVNTSFSGTYEDIRNAGNRNGIQESFYKLRFGLRINF